MEALRNLSLILATIAGLLLAGLTAIGGADGRWEHEGMFRVGNAPARTFAWLTEPENRMQWVGGIESCRAEDRLAPGVRMRETLRVGERRVTRDWEITAFELDRRIAMKTEVDGVRWEIDFLVQTGQSGKRSQVTYQCSVEHEGNWARVVEPILEARFLGRLNDDFERLEQLAESSY